VFLALLDEAKLQVSGLMASQAAGKPHCQERPITFALHLLANWCPAQSL
jgi:hypothetical protein